MHNYNYSLTRSFRHLPLAALVFALMFALVACDSTSPSTATLPTSTVAPTSQANGSDQATTNPTSLGSTPVADTARTLTPGNGSGTGNIGGVPTTPATQADAQGTAVTVSTATTEIKIEQPVAPEQNPPGDIPDTQAFVKYTSAVGSYDFEAPEGWARTESGADVAFVDKLDGVTLTITGTASPATAASARNNQVAALQKSRRAVEVTAVKDVTLPGGTAVLIEYTSNSEPNSVTGKQVRLENKAYLFYRAGKQATLTMWAPLGADNVDQWQRMAQSFRWH